MGRPAKEPDEKLVEVPCKVSPDVAEEIAAIAIKTDRYRSQIARKMIYRGLAAYRRDGGLDEPIDMVVKEVKGLSEKLLNWFEGLPKSDQTNVMAIVEVLYRRHTQQPIQSEPIPTENVDPLAVMAKNQRSAKKGGK